MTPVRTDDKGSDMQTIFGNGARIRMSDELIASRANVGSRWAHSPTGLFVGMIPGQPQAVVVWDDAPRTPQTIHAGNLVAAENAQICR